jgi:hypothetical protein
MLACATMTAALPSALCRLPSLAATLALYLALLVLPLGAQTVDPRGDWRTIRTAHFRVHFPRALESQGRRAAADAEGAWAQLAAELAPPRGPIDLVVADNADVSNGFASTFPSNRVVVFAQPPVDASSLRFYDDWLQLVITHELTHVFHLDRSRGVWRGLQYVFGRNPALFPNTYGPSWLTEGLAVYYESRLTGSGRLVGTEHQLVARAARLGGHVPRLDELSLAASVYPLGERAYAYGSLLVAYMATRGGDGTVRRFVDAQSGQLIPWRLDRAARRAFGESFTAGHAAWADGIRTDENAGRSDSAWRRLTDAGWSLAAPRWLDDRSLLVGANDARAVSGVDVVRLDGSRRRLGRRNSVGPNVPLRGGGILFAQLEFANPFTLRSDLYVQRDTAPVPQFGAASRGQRRLTFGARLSHPDARADGAIVAVQSGAGTTWLVRVDSSGRTIVPLTAASPDTQWTEPRWSPDGTRLAAVQIVRGGRSAIVVLDTLGAARLDLVRERAVHAAPSWSPDGRRVYWSSDRSGSPQLYVAELPAPDGTSGAASAGARLLTGVSTGLFEPAPSPAGGMLASLVFLADGYHLAVADTAALGVERPEARWRPYADSSRVSAAPVSSDSPAGAYRPWRSLLPRYWSPTFGTSDGGSPTLGAATSGNDVLGRHAYYATASVNTKTHDLEGGVSYRYARLVRPFVDVSASQAWQYDSIRARFANGTTGRDPHFRRDRVAALTLTVTRPRVRSGATLAVGALAERRSYTSTFPSLVTYGDTALGRNFPAVFASASWLNTRRPIRSISPEDGVALGGSVQQRWQDGRYGPQSRRAIGVARVYKSLDLPGFAHHVLALRVAGGATDERATTELSVGGVSGSSAEVVPGVRIGDPARTFGVRGFAPDAQQGIRALAGSLEYRAPLALPARGLRLLPVFADRLSIGAFADAGTAWCPGETRAASPVCVTTDSGAPTPRSPLRADWLASVGAELGLDAALAYDAPYRFRLGTAVPVRRRDLAARSASVYLSLGLAF